MKGPLIFLSVLLNQYENDVREKKWPLLLKKWAFGSKTLHKYPIFGLKNQQNLYISVPNIKRSIILAYPEFWDCG